MKPIHTALTRLFNIKTPIVSAPMAAVQGLNSLVAATQAAGGLGFYQASTSSVTDSPEKITSTITSLKRQLSVPERSPAPFGVAFLAWVLEKENPRGRIAAVLESRPAAIWFAYGNQLAQHIQQVREFDAQKSTKTQVFVTVNTVEQAVVAANDWKADVLVAQGYEAGGHGSSHSPPVSIFVQGILKAIPNAPPILAAGGIATGAQIASLLTLGASGVVLGTRLLFTTELAEHSAAKTSILVAANHLSTTRSMAFDEVRGTLGWPEGIDGRAVANGIINDQREGLPIEERVQRFETGLKEGKGDRLIVWAGAGVGLTHEVKDAQSVIGELHAETVETLRKAQGLLEDA